MTSTAPTLSSTGCEVWTIERILRWTQDFFAQKGIGTARLDAEVLLAHALGCNRVRLYTHFDQPLTGEERDAFRALVRRRANREPVAYLCGHREFFSRAFAVGPDVLIPRPETEHLVEAALAWLQAQGLSTPRILDVGTGSGALAVTLAAEVPGAHVTASDLSAAALQMAARNAAQHGVEARMVWAHGDLLAPISGPFDLIVSNPPYIPTVDRSTLERDVRDYEPAQALFAGTDGLDIVRRLIPQVRAALAQPGLFLCEFGVAQGAAVESLVRAAGFNDVTIVPDLQGHPRVVRAAIGAL